MDDLIFRQKKHEYITSDGKKLPSVSEIISCLSNSVYADVDKDILETAAQRGTAVHELSRELETKRILECPEEYSGYLQAYAKFLQEHSVNWTYIEEPMRHSKGYAGTLDRYGVVDDVCTLLDIKTNSKITGKNLVVYEAQLNLYRKMLEEHWCNPAKLYVLHLMKDGTYELYDIPISDELADICWLIYTRMHERKRRKTNGKPDKRTGSQTAGQDGETGSSGDGTGTPES